LAAINGAALVLTVIRIAVPSTTWFLFPTLSSFDAMGAELSFARDVIRSGVAPVIPLSGIIAILAIVFWAMGALLVWGLTRGRPYVAVLTPLVVYLEFAVMDRRPSGWWTTAFMVMIGIALLAVAFDRRRENTGLLTSEVTRLALVRSLPSVGVVTLLATLFVALIGSTALAGFVPRSGYLAWRSSSGLSGDYYGSVSYNPFVGIRQDLVSQTNVPVFVAEVEGDIAAGDVYWRLLTLDGFDGGQWHVAGRPDIDRPEDLTGYEEPDNAFQGPTATVRQNITVLALQMDWLPAAYSPTDMTATNRAVDRGFRVRSDDASLRFDALTYRGMSYSVVSEIPQPDLNVLSRNTDGAPSVVFSGAIDDDEFELDPTPEIVEFELADAERFLELPDDINPVIGLLAEEQTVGLETDFEKAIALESFFRAPGNFRYSTDIAPGHGAEDLTAWLVDPDSVNYRTGYCEQFSTSMAVMARMLGIPSRVVLGFTPGTLLEDGRVVVRDRNAHAWVELWMPTQGWVRFDPTPRGDGINPATTGNLPFDPAEYLDIPAADAPEFESDLPDPILLVDEDPLDIPRFPGASGNDAIPTPTLPSWLLPLGIGALLIFGLVPAVKWSRRRRRIRRLQAGDISAAWREIVDRLSDLGAGPDPWTTPLEFAEATDPVMRPLANAYGEDIYGSDDQAGDGTIAVASRSLEDTEDRIGSRYSGTRRLVARYRVRTLLPRWMKRRRRG